MTFMQLTPDSSQTKPSLRDRRTCAKAFGLAAFLHMTLVVTIIVIAPAVFTGTFYWSAINLLLIGGLTVMPAIGGGVAAFFLAPHFRKDMERGHPYFYRGLLTSFAVTATAFAIAATPFAIFFALLEGLDNVLLIFGFGGAIYLLPALPTGALAGWVYWRLTKRYESA